MKTTFTNRFIHEELNSSHKSCIARSMRQQLKSGDHKIRENLWNCMPKDLKMLHGMQVGEERSGS